MTRQFQARVSHRSTARAALASTSTAALVAASLAGALTLFGGSSVLAATPDQPPSGQPVQIQEIIVTAQKQAQPLEKVPVSVTVIEGQTLQALNNNSLQDLGTTLPGLHIVNTGSFGNSLNIRGIGSGSGNPAFDQSVAAFEDDIYIGRSRMIQASFLDMDQVEVLKGPQTTFFGNNAIAGALNMTTKKPDDQFGGYFRVLGGSFGTYAVEGAAGGPVTDKLAIRVAATVNGDQGWIHNVFDDNKLVGGQANVAGRVTAVYKPTSDLDATLKLEGGSNRILGSTTPTPYQWTNCPPPAPLAAGAVNQNCTTIHGTPGALQTPGEPFGLNNNLDAAYPGQYADLTTHAEVLTINYHRWGLTFTSVTGEYGYRFRADEDKFDTGINANTLAIHENYEQFSQEFRVSSPVGRPIEYMVGAYFQHDSIDEGGIEAVPYVSGVFNEALGIPTVDLPLGFDIGYRQNENIESIFGSVAWNATEKLKFNLGLRGTSDEKDFQGQIVYGTALTAYPTSLEAPPVPLLPLQAANAETLGAAGIYPYSRTDRALTGSVGAQYQIEPQAMLYISVSRGFKAGGFNAISPAVTSTAGPGFGPEFVTSYELGLKGKWLDNRLLVNFDVFRENYTGLQVNSLVQVATIAGAPVFDSEFTNAANSLSQGVELQTQWLIGKNFKLIAEGSYLDAHYVSFPDAASTYLGKQDGQETQNLSGAPLDFAPRWSGTLTAEYATTIFDDYRLTADLTPIFNSSYFNSNGTDDPQLLIKSSMRWDGQLTLAQLSKHWAIDIIGKNLTNRVIVVEPDQNEIPGAKQEPRNVALQFRYKW